MAAVNLEIIKRPELIIAIAGPIGIQTDNVIQALQTSLESVNYKSKNVKISAEMEEYPVTGIKIVGRDYLSAANYKMNYATELCRARKNAATLAIVAVRAIQRMRGEGPVPEGVAYLISQLKRPQEVDLLRRVYGKQFILVSAHGDISSRLNWIIEQTKLHLSAELTANEIEKRAKDLMDRDAEEPGDDYGQHLRDTFHMADVFVDGMDFSATRITVDRFIQAFFGRVDIAPSRQEYGMYVAKSASLRSTDLSRQVGAAIFSKEGEIITQGCNEVPKAFGGTFWDLESPDFRDVKIGYDPNEQLRNEILRDLFQRLKTFDYLSDELKLLPSISDIVIKATAKNKGEGSESGPLNGALIMDLTEYGRVVHAEMCAICDAARLGKSIKGSTLYCTTFPCHNCAKHIIASGITKVFYIEPYAKSRAKELHKNEIEIDSDSASRVAFRPFLGISPMRYRDIFQKGRRKNAAGIANQWIGDGPLPMVEIFYTSYIRTENFVQTHLVVDFLPAIAANTPPTPATPDVPTPRP